MLKTTLTVTPDLYEWASKRYPRRTILVRPGTWITMNHIFQTFDLKNASIVEWVSKDGLLRQWHPYTGKFFHAARFGGGLITLAQWVPKVKVC